MSAIAALPRLHTMSEALANSENPSVPVPNVTSLPRLAYSVRETAEILGVSEISVYRLLERKLLRSSKALRHKLISRAEIERFLAETAK